MATWKPLVHFGGKNRQLPAADSIDVPGARFHEGPTEPTIKDYGDRWLDTSSGIKYTWVDPGIWVDLSEPTSADIAEAIHAATSKTTPVDADELGIADSADSWALKRLTWANLRTTVLTFLGGLYGKTNILGTVSQTSGVPTGAVIEHGTNSNGRFVRFADGTQICRATITETRAIATAYAGGFRDTGSVSTNLPAAFIDTDYELTFSTTLSSNAFSYIESPAGRTASAFAAVPTAVATQASASRTFSYIAIGRWFT